MNDKTMSPRETIQVCTSIDRAELYQDPVVYLKAVRATLIALGYESEQVNGSFRDLLESYYADAIADASTARSEANQDPIDGLLTVSQAAALWDLNSSTIRRAIMDGRLKQNLDCIKFGNQWAVSRAAMNRLYGECKHPLWEGLSEEDIAAAIVAKDVREEQRTYNETMLENCSGDML